MYARRTTAPLIGALLALCACGDDDPTAKPGDTDTSDAADTGDSADAADSTETADAADSGDAPDAPDGPDGNDADTGGQEMVVRVVGLQSGDEARPHVEALEQAVAGTGVSVVYQSADVEELVANGFAGVDADVAFVAQPGALTELARQGLLVDISEWLDLEQLRASYSPYLLSLVTVGEDGSWPSATGAIHGGWGSLSVKSLIWYPTPETGEAGYDLPETWEALIALSDRIVADGSTPWCLGVESGGATGWPATDWIEDIMLRTAGPALYDQWVAGEIPFSHEAVRRAFELFGDILFTPGYQVGDADHIVSTPFFDAMGPIFDDPPGCWLHRQASFGAFFFPEGTTPGVDADVFPFPRIDEGLPDTLLGAGDMFVVLHDRPAVRTLVEGIVAPDYGSTIADESPFISANRTFDLDAYGDNTFVRRQAELVQAALAEDGFRFDASDLMPFEVGAGSFWVGMVDYILGGPDSLDQVLADIAASWPER